MVYKRYIKRGGKTFGPYYYHSVRSKNGKIKSLYSGKPSDSLITLHNLMLLFLVFSVLFALIILKPTLSGLLVRAPEYTALIEEGVFQEIEQNGSATVVVILKPSNIDNNLLSISSASPDSVEGNLENIRESVQKQQDNVLSTLNLGGQGGDFGIASETASESDFSLSHKYSLSGVFSGQLTENGLAKLGNNPDVEKISLVETYQIDLAESVPLINASLVWQIQANGKNMTGDGQTICIIDTGINYNHSDLGSGFGNKVIGQYCYCSVSGPCCSGGQVEKDTAMDDNGHGTHVAGIVAANGTIKGVAPGAKLIALKACSAAGFCSDTDILKAIEWCVNNATKYNISVISMSLGNGARNTNYCDSGNIFTNAINAAVLNRILVSVSSGNDGYSDGISSPGCIRNATAVGAVTKFDSIQYNRWNNKIVLAPGVSITSTCIGGGSCTMSGTSMAAPHVAGAAALLQQYSRDYGNFNITPREIENILLKTGKLIYDSVSGLYFKRINVLAAVNSIFIVNISENSLEKSNVAKIIFDTSTDFTDVSDAFTVSSNLISLDSSRFPQFNKPATLQFYNLTFQKTPVILKDNQLCPEPYCNVFSYFGNNLTFKVGGFTNYSAGTNSNLVVWDYTDSSMSFYSGSTIAKKNQQTYFFANYTNRTSGQPVNSASCNITFPDGIWQMNFSDTKLVFEYNRTLNLSGIIPFTITCNHTDFETLAAFDNIEIIASFNCTYPGSTYNWIINSSISLVICNDENLLLNQSNLIVDNSIFVLNNTNMYLIDGENNLTVSSDSTLSVINSLVETRVPGFMTNINVSGNLSMQNSILNRTKIFLSGNNNLLSSNVYGEVNLIENSVNTISGCNFYPVSDEVFNCLGNSKNYIYNSFLNNISFQSNSYSEISNSILNNIDVDHAFLSDFPIINFTASQSTILSINQISIDGSKIYGYVNMPNSLAIWQDGVVIQRYYPIYITSAGVPTQDKNVSITDKDGNLIWNGITDANGYIEANLTFNKSNYGAGNFTLSVNPSQDISFFTDTPINFELMDSIKPSWSGNASSVPSTYSTSPLFFNITWTDNMNITTVFIEGNWSGIAVNYTMHSPGNNVYNFNVTLPAGTYYWRSHANDTSNNWNSSDLWTFTISKSLPIASLSLSPSSTITYDDSVNATCNGDLFRNNQNITSEIGHSKMLAAGLYNYSCRLYETQNYSYDDDNHTLTVNKDSPTLELLLNSVESGITIMAGNSVNLTAYSSIPSLKYVELFLQNSKISAGTGILYNQPQFSSVGTYNVTLIYPSTQNYSQGSVTRYVTVNFQTQPTQQIQQQPGGGASGGGAGCTENWNCTEWSSCVNRMQFRTCVDLNRCWTYVNRPVITQQCGSLEENINPSIPGQNISQPEQNNQPAMPAICDMNWLLISIMFVLSAVNSYLLWKSSRKKEDKKGKKKKSSRLSSITEIILFAVIAALAVYLVYLCQNNLIPVIVIAILLILYILRVMAFKKMQKSDNNK